MSSSNIGLNTLDFSFIIKLLLSLVKSSTKVAFGFARSTILNLA